MIIGNGMMANRFRENYSANDDFVIFASGVSDSSERNKSAFEREEKLLLKYLDLYPSKTLVYFGTCSIFDPALAQSQYVFHKLKMEEIIKISISQYVICRTTNIVGNNGNPNTLINFLINKIEKEEQFDLWANAFRNILDIEDLFTFVHSLLSNKSREKRTITNIFSPRSYSAFEIVSAIETHLQKKANCRIIEKGAQYEIPELTDLSSFHSSKLFQSKYTYLPNLLKKYHPVSEPA